MHTYGLPRGKGRGYCCPIGTRGCCPNPCIEPLRGSHCSKDTYRRMRRYLKRRARQAAKKQIEKELIDMLDF